MGRHAGLGLWMLLALGCGDKTSPMATREECAKVAEHIADLIIADAKANPDGLWDAVGGAGSASGIPADVTKPVFKLWLDSTQGQTWMMQRRGQTLSGTQQGIDACTKNATREQVKCLLGSKSKADVEACDRARKAATPASPATAGSAAAGSADGSADGSAVGSAAH